MQLSSDYGTDLCKCKKPISYHSPPPHCILSSGKQIKLFITLLRVSSFNQKEPSKIN